MSTASTNGNGNTNADDGSSVPHGGPPDPAAPGDPRQTAGELLAHGLLTYLNADSAESQAQRVQRVMAALHSEPAVHVVGETHSRTLRFPSHMLRKVLAAAACIALVAAGFMLGFPAAPSAQAMVQQSIQAMRSGGDRRYEIRVMEWGDDQIAADPIAVVDTRAPDLLVLRHVTPQRDLITVGRDAEGLWAIGPDGSVERTNPRQRWPKWATVGEESLFADSIDRVLEELSKGFDIKRDQEGKGALAGTTKITATRKPDARGPGPDRFELWLNSTTTVVEKIELSWDKQPMGEPRPRGPVGPGGLRRGPGDRPMRDGPRDDFRGEPFNGPRNGPPPRGPRDQMPHDNPPDDGPDGDSPNDDGLPPPPPNDHRRPPMGPGPRGPLGGPDGQRNPDDFDGPGGPEGRGPRTGMGGRPRPPIDPRLMDGFVPGGRPPRMDPLARVGPPHVIIMQRVEVKQPLGNEWFSAKQHAG